MFLCLDSGACDLSSVFWKATAHLQPCWLPEPLVRYSTHCRALHYLLVGGRTRVELFISPEGSMFFPPQGSSTMSVD